VNEHYVEQNEVWRYIGRWYNHLFTESERCGPTVEWLRDRVTDASQDDVNAVINERYDGHEQRPIVAKLLAAIDEFTEHSIARILRDHPDEVTLARCPDCGKIAASPNARQCLWCGNDWHATGLTDTGSSHMERNAK